MMRSMRVALGERDEDGKYFPPPGPPADFVQATSSPGPSLEDTAF